MSEILYKGKNSSNEEFQIYSLDYLKSQELTEEDLYWMFDTPSLVYSLVVGMFNHCGIDMSPSDIIEMCRKNSEWYMKYKFTAEQHKSFEDLLTSIYKNVYQYREASAHSSAQWFLFGYGFAMDKEEYEKLSKLYSNKKKKYMRKKK